MGRPTYEAGGYHDRNGMGPLPSSAVGQRWGLYYPRTKWTWSFMVVTLAQCIISLAIELYVFVRFQENLKGSARAKNPPSGALTIPTYLALFIFGFLFELVLVWDALRLKNTIQVIGVCFYNVGMLIYAAVENNQIDDAVGSLVDIGAIDPDTWGELRPFLIAAPCVVALCTVTLDLIAWKLYDEFAWTIYKHISADLRLKRRYLTYQIYIAFLKFDFFFFLGFTVQFLVVVQDQQARDAEFYITIIAMPVTIALLFLAAYVVRRESYIGHIFIIVLYFAAMAYFVFKLTRIYGTGPQSEGYEPIKHSLTWFAVLTILMLIVTIVVAFLCMRNFNKGLAPHIQQRAVPGPDEIKYGTYEGGYAGAAHQLGSVPSRMTID